MTPESAPNAAPLPDPPTDRLFYTFVFTDIVGSSAMTTRFEEKLGPGEYEKLRNKQRKFLLRFVRHYDGWEAQRMGDGHFLVFTSAANALQAIVKFQEKIRQDPAKVILDNNEENVVVRAGIHTCELPREPEKNKMMARELYEYSGRDTKLRRARRRHRGRRANFNQ